MFPRCSDKVCLDGVALTPLWESALVCDSLRSLSSPLPLSLPPSASLPGLEPSLTKAARHYGVEEAEEI